MDIFEKTAKTVKNASESVISSAKNIGISLYSSTKEQGELAGLNVQKSAIEKKLTDCYTEIGKRYVEYIANCNSGTAFFNVADILESMQPELDQLAQIKEQIQEKEIQIKQAAEEKAQKKAQEEFDVEKEKLDRALRLDILSEEELLDTSRLKQKKESCIC